jgi:hypothetical protein
MTGNIVVGGKYTLKNGDIWSCIYTTDVHAYMIEYDGGTAYVWKRDGKAVSLGSNPVYDADWWPVAQMEEITMTNVDGMGLAKATVKMNKGKPDWATLKVKEDK